MCPHPAGGDRTCGRGETLQLVPRPTGSRKATCGYPQSRYFPPWAADTGHHLRHHFPLPVRCETSTLLLETHLSVAPGQEGLPSLITPGPPLPHHSREQALLHHYREAGAPAGGGRHPRVLPAPSGCRCSVITVQGLQDPATSVRSPP